MEKHVQVKVAITMLRVQLTAIAVTPMTSDTCIAEVANKEEERKCKKKSDNRNVNKHNEDDASGTGERESFN